ncbi:MAG: hypothetical protein ABII23_00520 [bacterium]
MSNCKPAQKNRFILRDSQDCIQPVTSSESSRIIVSLLHEIHEEFKKIKSKYPHLSGIDNAQVICRIMDKDVVEAGLMYEKNIIQKNSPDKYTVGESGCIINLIITYPAKPFEDTDKRLLKPLKLKNGKYLDIWNIVDTESTKTGDAFVNEAYKIINPYLVLLKKRLEKL